MKQTKKKGHPAADYMKWDEAMRVVTELYDDGKFRESMLIASGCFLGLRISDLLKLRWSDLCNSEDLTVQEKKTGKERSMRLNHNLRDHTMKCWEAEGQPDMDSYIFNSQQYEGTHYMTRQRADQLLKEIKKDYRIRSAKVFSTHSLRKTFGRRVWEKECENGRGDLALMRLCEVFGHADTRITKRYLGITKDEILSVYDSLEI